MSVKPTYEELEQRISDLEKTIVELNKTVDKPVESDQWYKILFERSPDSIFISDLEGNFIDANDSAFNLLGYSRDEIRTLNYGTLIIREEDLVKAMEFQAEIIETGIQSELCELELKQKDGGTVYIETHGFALYRDETPYAILGIARDVTKRKKTEIRIQYGREIFRVLANTVTDVLWVLDIKDERFTFFSPSVESCWGWTVEEALELSYKKLVTPESLTYSINAMAEEFNSSKPGEIRSRAIELEHFRKDGSTFWVETKSSFAINTNGEPTHLVGITRDITERKQSEEALRKSEEKFRSIAERNFDLIFDLDKDGRITYVSPAIGKMFNRKPEDVLGESFTDFVPESDLQRINEVFSNVISGIDIGEVQVPAIIKDGSRIFIEFNVDHIIEDGEIAGIQGVLRDITQRKLVEEALKESEKKYRLLVENANDAIFIAQDGVLKFANPKAVEMTGYSEKELAEIPFINSIHPEDRDMVSRRYEERLSGKNPPSTYSFRVTNKSGKILWVQMNAVSLTWNDKPATLVLLRDVTSQKKLESQLQQSRKMEAIGRLAGGIAHDFNNILGAIVLNTEMAIEDAPGNSSITYSLKQVLKSSVRAKELVEQILTFSRNSEEKRQTINAATVVHESLKMLRPIIPSTILIQQDVFSDSGTILADSTQIQQLIMNLCTNAAHAMSENGGTLKVGLIPVSIEDTSNETQIPPGQYVKLSVSDSGHGIGPEEKDLIFDPFFTTKAPGAGTGLGLSVVHGIVISHGGRIKVDSVQNKGTTFEIFLPRIDETVISVQKDELVLPTGHEKILFVDDEKALVDAVERMLIRLGYRVVTALNSNEALDAFSREPEGFDLVITDMTMPYMTGLELSREIIKIRPDIPIIICSGHNNLSVLDKAKETGIIDYVMKPFIKQEMAEAIRNALDSN